MSIWNSRTLHLKSDNGNCRGHVPPIDEIAASPTLRQKAYARVLDFLDAEVAERAYTELMEDPRYVRVDGVAETGDPSGYRLGILKSVNQNLSPNVQMCCDLMTSVDFRNWIAKLVEHPIRVVKPPSLFRMEKGDRIETHDDIADHPSNRVSVILHLSKNWRREFGGNTVLGEVKRVEKVRTVNSEYFVHRWVFSLKRSVLTPAFNSLTVITLRPGMAHEVTSVRVKAYRVSIVGLYALEEEKPDALITIKPPRPQTS